ncbi:salivary glue protein Sgs-3-like, partial [Anopheles bellator]|uniref:salivary glue protein Sgs-3-like n=1 Tax=Anopheles bellator TaxID=139047 RepID=UPI0026470BD9
MAPRPLQNLTTPKPPGAVSGNLFYHSDTTTWRPSVTVTTYSPGAAGTSSDIPPIIKFPEDVFQGIRPLADVPRYLNKSTLRPYTVRQRVRPTVVQNNALDLEGSEGPGGGDRLRVSTPRPTTRYTTYPATVRTRTPATGTTIKTKTPQTPAVTQTFTRRPTTTTTTTTMAPTTTEVPTTTTPSRKRYTIRPQRGQQRWRTTTEAPPREAGGAASTTHRPTNNNLTKARPRDSELDERLPN